MSQNSKPTLEPGKTYRNRRGGTVKIHYDGRDPNYPFTDRLGTTYTRHGKVWKGKESNYDLIKQEPLPSEAPVVRSFSKGGSA